MSHIVTDKCVDQVTANNKRYFSDGKLGEGLKNMIDEYR